ncbi:Aldehyde/histidinol dehydrogenase [Schizophyllum commune]
MNELHYTPLEEIERIRASLHAGFASGKSKALAYRKYQLLQLGHLLKENRARFVDAIHADMGRPAFESEFYEISGALTDITAAVKNLSSWAKTETSPFDFNWFAMRPRAHKLPKGVVLVITPFNYSLGGKSPVIVDASADPPLAAGCFVNAGQTCVSPDSAMGRVLLCIVYEVAGGFVDLGVGVGDFVVGLVDVADVRVCIAGGTHNHRAC